MENTNNSLDQAVETHFEVLKQRVRHRLSAPTELNWLIEPSSINPYRPDYLTMRTAGRTRLEQETNKLLGHYLPKVWFRFFWPKIRDRLIRYSEQNYFPKLFSNERTSVSVLPTQQYISRALRSILFRNWEHLRDATFTEISNCLLAVIHEPLKRLPIEQDFFLPDKVAQNSACLQLFRELNPALRRSKERLQILAYLCCRSNWIDSLEANVTSLLSGFILETETGWKKDVLRSSIPPDSVFFQRDRFRHLIECTKGPVLYETDNCGEIVFDLVMVQELVARGRMVYLCPKQCPMVNDAMEKDVLGLLAEPEFIDLKNALQTGRLKLVTTGPFVGGGKLPHEIEPEYRAAYLAADLLIIKGQGNFQSMPMGARPSKRFIPYRYRKPILYMTGIKADMIQMCLHSIFRSQQVPTANTMLLYGFDPDDPRTYP